MVKGPCCIPKNALKAEKAPTMEAMGKKLKAFIITQSPKPDRHSASLQG